MNQPLSNSDGSADWVIEHIFHQPSTKVVCSVNGPLEVKSRDELPREVTIEVVVRPIEGLTTIRETLMQEQIHSCLRSIVIRHLLPRSLIEVVVQVLSAGESSKYTVNELTAAINASTIALVNAGIPLNGVVVSVAAAYVDGEILINPGADDLEKSTSTHTFAFKISNGPENPDIRLVLCHSLGSFNTPEFLDCLDIAQQTSLETYTDMREKIEKYYEGSTKWHS